MTTIQFPQFTGIKCNMMPFIQGDSASLPDQFKPYAAIIDSTYLEKGEVGFLTLDEKFVEAGKSQRGFNSFGLTRNVHIEVGTSGKWGSGGCSWGGKPNTMLSEETKVLIANSLSGTCRFWNSIEKRFTEDGDLSEYIADYPEETGFMLNAGQVAQISIFTPHEPIAQTVSAPRQFFRIVGKGVTGREPYFTVNPLVNWN